MQKNFHLLTYRPARLVCTKGNWYVAFSAVNPATGKLKYFRKKINHVRGNKTIKREYGAALVEKLNTMLAAGWSPFLRNSESQNAALLLSDVIKKYFLKIRRDLENDNLRESTYDDYLSHLQLFQSWLKNDIFLHDIKRITILDFLDYIYIDKKRAAQTRNNYFCTLRTFFNYCYQYGYITENPTDGITILKIRDKRRKAIPDIELKQIFGWLDARPGFAWFALAADILFSCFIRPNEMAHIKIQNISFVRQTISIPGEISKNRQTQTVTITANVAARLHKLKVWEYPENFYLFGYGGNLGPGENPTNPRIFRAWWDKVRTALNLPPEYQFYSLKNSGITKMLKRVGNALEVRNQARHSSLAITNIYAAGITDGGNENLKKLDMSK